MRWFFCFIFSFAPCLAVEFRVATFNVGAHFTESAGGVFYPEYGIGAPGTPDHETVKAVLARIDADVVALQEIDSADSAGNPNDVNRLATSLGYPHVYIAPVGSSGGLAAPFDSDLRVAVLSRYPFLTATAIRSPAGAREMTRLHAVVKVDVPGTTRDPVIITGHLKAGSGTTDRLRRAVEMKRIASHLTTLGLTRDDNFIITGDFNLNPNYASTTFSSLPSGLPATYSLGSDYPLPILYSTNPLAYFSQPAATRVNARQLNGSAVTFSGGSGYTLDLILVSPAIASRPYAAEIYNSALDSAATPGLPKAGLPLASDISGLASDHFAVFADLELDSSLPELTLSASAPSLAEGMPDGTVTLTVNLPATLPTSLTVSLVSDDDYASPTAASVVIPAGGRSAVVAIKTPRNFQIGPPRTVSFTAKAPGFDPGQASLTIHDAEGPYAFARLASTVAEDFLGFRGGYDPAPWITGGSQPWQGSDDGSSALPGWRSYGSGSLGFLPASNASTAEATYFNHSDETIRAVKIRRDVSQWRSALGGAASAVRATLVHGGSEVPLPGLSYEASTTMPDGAIGGGNASTEVATVTGLSIPPGASFTLRFIWTPGSGSGVLPDGVFINEFHYDNVGTDVGEFVEVVVGPGNLIPLQDLSLFLYNGSNPAAATTYGAPLPLSTFTSGENHHGYTFLYYEFPQDGLQNGGNDGFALVNTATSQVLQLISYEGVFTAANGPAAGMTSVDVGVEQTNSTPVGSSIGLTGSGSAAADFTWVAFPSGESKGSPNSNQSMTTPALPSQGVALEYVEVTAFGGGDTDGDGQRDIDELAFGTDPLDSTSVFRPVLVGEGGEWSLQFPGAQGITYTVEWSTDLIGWEPVSTHLGSGLPVIAPLPGAEPAMFFRVKVSG